MANLLLDRIRLPLTEIGANSESVPK